MRVSIVRSHDAKDVGWVVQVGHVTRYMVVVAQAIGVRRVCSAVFESVIIDHFADD